MGMLLDGTLGMMGSMLSGVPWLYHWLDRVKLFSWLIFTLFCSLYSLLSSTRSKKITFYKEKYSKIIECFDWKLTAQYDF